MGQKDQMLEGHLDHELAWVTQRMEALALESVGENALCLADLVEPPRGDTSFPFCVSCDEVLEVGEVAVLGHWQESA